MKGYKQIVVTDRQSVTDILLQEYGCYEALTILFADNPVKLVSLHDVPDAGTKLLIRTPVPRLTDTNQAIAAAYALKQVTVVNGAEAQDHSDYTSYIVADYWDELYTL